VGRGAGRRKNAPAGESSYGVSEERKGNEPYDVYKGVWTELPVRIRKKGAKKGLSHQSRTAHGVIGKKFPEHK